MRIPTIVPKKNLKYNKKLLITSNSTIYVFKIVRNVSLYCLYSMKIGQFLSDFMNIHNRCDTLFSKQNPLECAVIKLNTVLFLGQPAQAFVALAF
jgi:hypothetical protein